MKILIAGDGKVGETLTRELLAEGHELTLIDSDQAVLERTLEKYDIMAIHGNCASMDTLEQAGVGDAEVLIAATNADEVNMLCCMTARGLNPNLHTIARIRNPEYIDQTYKMPNVFALSMAINPERQAAVEIERLLSFPGFLKRDTFAKGRVAIVELRVEAGSKLSDVPLSRLSSIIKCRVLVCAVLRDGSAVTPDGSFILRSGDRIFVTAPTADLTTLLKNLGVITRKVNRVIICGGGVVAYYLARLLCQRGIAVQIIEKDYDRCVHLAETLPEAAIIRGDASNRSLLESEGLSQSDAIVAMTGLDELNIIISLYASSRGVPQVITKMGRVDDISILDDLPLGSIICPKELCSSTIVRYVRAVKNQTGAAVAIHDIADGQAEAIEFVADETTLHCGEPLKKLRTRKNVLVACISHGRETIIPNGDSVITPGDHVIIVTSGGEVVYQLNDIFE